MKAPTSSDKRLRLFENRWLEKLTVISVGWFLALWSVVLTLVGAWAWGSAPWFAVIPLIGAGWLLLTLFEYSLHRFIFHWTPKSDALKQIVFVMHGNHHLQPTDKLRSLMPPIVSFPIGVAAWALLDTAFGQASEWMLFGFLLGYVAYDLTHYATHQWPMRGAFGQKLKRHHLKHHFVSEEGNYAVTGLFWDRVFGTQAKITKRSSAAKTTPFEAPEPAE